MATSTSQQFRRDDQGNVYKVVNGREIKLTSQAAQSATQKYNLQSPQEQQQAIQNRLSTPGAKTVYLESGGSINLNDRGEITGWGGTLAPGQMNQAGIDAQRAALEQEFREGKIANVFDYKPGQGTQWATGATNYSPFAVDLQTAARNAGQVPMPPGTTTQPTTTTTPTMPIPTTGVPTPYASLDYERAQRERAMNEAINRLNTDFSRLNQNIQQDRTLENLQLARNLNPFSGRSDYAMGILNMERARTDRERQEDLENRIAAIRGGYLDFVNAMPGLEREYQNEQAQRAYQNALQYAQLFGYLPGSVPTPFSGLSGVLPNFTGGGGGNTAPLTLAAQNQLFNQAMNLREFAQADQAQRAAMTGRYLPPEAQPLLEELLNLKTAAEQPGIPRDQLTQYRTRADQIRQQLALLGVDPSLFGSDVPYAQALQNVATGLPTYEARITDREFQYRAARDAIADQRWKMEFDEDVRRFGLEYALQRQIQLGNLDIDRMNAATARMNAQTSAANAEFNRFMDAWRAQGIAPYDFNLNGTIIRAGTPYYDPVAARQVNQPDTISPSDYKTNPDFAQDVQYIKSNPKKAMNDLKQYAAQFIQAYGYDGYRALINELPKKERDELLGNLDEFYP